MVSARSVTFGSLLKQYRMAAGLTQEELAARAGISAQAIGSLERGARRAPRRDTIQLLAGALALSEPERVEFEAAARGRAGPSRSSVAVTMLAPPPLFGRGAEVAALTRHMAGIGPPVLVLTGEPGIGKSRLLAEIVEPARLAGWTVLAGGCHRRSGQEPYEPLLQALSRYIARQPPARRRFELQGCSWLVRLLPELAESTTVPAPSWNLPPAQERRLMFAAASRLLTNIAGTAGTLLLLDDLHWAGADALDLLAALVRSATAPLRVVAAYRDSDVRPYEPLAVLLADLARSSQATQVKLNPLAEADAAALLGELLAGSTPTSDDGDIRARVLRLAGGVPFFLVSCAHALRSGALADAEVDDLPWDVAQTVRQRVAALPPLAQSLVATAAVAGRQTPARTLLATADQPRHDVLAALEDACHARLLAEAGDSYLFVHDLIREVVLAELSEQRRKMLHGEIAEALEQPTGDLPIEELAYHFSRAGALDRAVVYLRQAGERAQARHAYAQAAGYYHDLVESLDRLGLPMEAAEAREKLAFVLRTQARYEEALQLLERAVADAAAAGDVEGVVRAEAEIATIHGIRGTAKDGVERLRPLVESLGDRPLSARALAALYGGMARLLGEGGRYEEALTATERSAEFARAADDVRLLGQAEHRRGKAFAELGRLDEAIDVVEQAIPLLERSGELRSLCNAVNTIGCIHEVRGEIPQAAARFAHALDLAEPLNDPTMTATLIANLGGCAFQTGDWDGALAQFDRALVLFDSVSASLNRQDTLRRLGQLALARGDELGALAHLREAIAIADRSGDLAALRPAHAILAEHDLIRERPDLVHPRLDPLLDRPGLREVQVTVLLPLVAWAHLELGSTSRAEALLDESIARATAQGLRPTLVETLRVGALLAGRSGNWQAASAALDQALQTARTLGFPYIEARLQHAAGVVSSWAGDIPAARARLETALALYNRLGERHYAPLAARALAEPPSVPLA